MVNVAKTEDTSCKRPKRKPACGKKCSKPGPITNNGYLNFLRSFRRKNCGLLPRELVSKAARAWNCLPENVKNKYRRQACLMTHNPKHKARPVCVLARKARRAKNKKCKK